MNRYLGIGMGIVVGLLGAIVASAEPPGGAGTRRHPGPGDAMHAEMRAEMQAQDARLGELVAAMNAAEGDQKIDAIAAVVNELVDQRRARRAHMEERWQAHQARRAAHARDDEDEDDEDHEE
jgi:hypothetical protein